MINVFSCSISYNLKINYSKARLLCWLWSNTTFEREHCYILAVLFACAIVVFILMQHTVPVLHFYATNTL